MNSVPKLSKRYQRGLVVLVVLITLVIITPRLFGFFYPSDKWIISETELNEEVVSMNQTIQFSEKKWKKKSSKFKRPSSKFDPNKFDANDWMKLGLSQKQSDIIVKFTNRGVYSNEELQQIFVLPEQLFELIKDSTVYPERKSTFVKYEKTDYVIKQKDKSIIVDLNKATEKDLVDLDGIGPYFAQKILEYRSKLGGFYSKEQLLEVWKLDQEKLNNFEDQIIVNQGDVVKLNINTASAEELKNHPYISWNIANSIVKIRSKKEKFNSLNEIMESVLIDKVLFEKIKHYLTI